VYKGNWLKEENENMLSVELVDKILGNIKIWHNNYNIKELQNTLFWFVPNVTSLTPLLGAHVWIFFPFCQGVWIPIVKGTFLPKRPSLTYMPNPWRKKTLVLFFWTHILTYVTSFSSFQ
jgi:Ni,Fe-hydrogenase I cytochrome b subunit